LKGKQICPKKRKSRKNKTSCQIEKNKDLLTRRDFLGTMTAVGAVGLIRAAAKSSQQEKQKMPIWTGDLKSTTKQISPTCKTSKSNGLNMIVVITDTWRADHLGCYGSTHIKTPYLDEFAKDSVVFTNAHAEGLPTIPCRRVYHTGRSVLPEAKW